MPNRTYDPVEYNYAIQLTVNATHAVHRCNAMETTEFDNYVQKLNSDSFTLVEYVSNKSNAGQILPEAKQLRMLVEEFTSKDAKSEMYCKHKLSNIQAGSRIFARVDNNNTGGFNYCQDDLKNRYVLFEQSFNKQLISQTEFKELSDDLLKLKTVDTRGCVIQIRNKMQEDIKYIEKALSIIKLL
jgi:hypothetical protein